MLTLVKEDDFSELFEGESGSARENEGQRGAQRG